MLSKEQLPLSSRVSCELFDIVVLNIVLLGVLYANGGSASQLANLVVLRSEGIDHSNSCQHRDADGACSAQTWWSAGADFAIGADFDTFASPGLRRWLVVRSSTIFNLKALLHLYMSANCCVSTSSVTEKRTHQQYALRKHSLTGRQSQFAIAWMRSGKSFSIAMV